MNSKSGYYWIFFPTRIDKNVFVQFRFICHSLLSRITWFRRRNWRSTFNVNRILCSFYLKFSSRFQYFFIFNSFCSISEKIWATWQCQSSQNTLTRRVAQFSFTRVKLTTCWVRIFHLNKLQFQRTDYKKRVLEAHEPDRKNYSHLYSLVFRACTEYNLHSISKRETFDLAGKNFRCGGSEKVSWISLERVRELRKLKLSRN